MKEKLANISKPIVSVIIPTHNSESTISECLESVINTDFSRREIIVVDDGSNDNTLEILKNYDEIETLSRSYKSSAKAKNEGAKIAQGEYLYFLDSDVIIQKDTIAKLFNTAKKYSVDLVVGRYSTDPMNNKLIHHYKALIDYVLYIPIKYRNTVYIDGQIGGGGDFISRKVFEILGGFNEKYRGASVEREELYIRFYKEGCHSAANPKIITKHYYPDLKSMIKAYITRIYETIELLENENPPFTYISKNKSLFVPLISFLFILSIILFIFGKSYIPMIVLFSIFLVLNNDLIGEAIRRKGFSKMVKILLLHIIISCIIFISIAISGMIIKLKKWISNESFTFIK